MFKEDIKKIANENENFREVLYTGDYSQIVIMNLLPGEEIGEETHQGIDQILICVDGEGESVVEGNISPFREHDAVFVPSGTVHNFRNISDQPLKIFTIYSPPAHPRGTVHKTKADALKSEEEKEPVSGGPNDYLENM